MLHINHKILKSSQTMKNRQNMTFDAQRESTHKNWCSQVSWWGLALYHISKNSIQGFWEIRTCFIAQIGNPLLGIGLNNLYIIGVGINLLNDSHPTFPQLPHNQSSNQTKFIKNFTYSNHTYKNDNYQIQSITHVPILIFITLTHTDKKS